MHPSPITPLFTTDRFDETVRFYREHLGFGIRSAMPGYAELEKEAGGPALAFMQPCDQDDWKAGQGGGLAFCFAVADADAEHARLVREGVTIREAPEDRPWGERGFMALDPNGIALYFGHPLPSSVETGGAAK